MGRVEEGIPLNATGTGSQETYLQGLVARHDTTIYSHVHGRFGHTKSLAVFRVCCALWSVTICLLGLIGKPSDFFLMLTNISFCLVAVYFCVSAILSVRYHFLSRGQDDTTVYALWVCGEIAVGVCILVSVVYWSAIYPAVHKGYSTVIFVYSIQAHSLNCGFMLTELVFGNMVVHPAHILYLLIYGILYLIWAWIQYGIWHSFPYPFLDPNFMPDIFFVYLALFAALIVSYLIVFALSSFLQHKSKRR